MKKKYKFLILYTLSFLLIAAFIYYGYYQKGNSLICYDGDGYLQHYKGLLYTSDYLKTIFTTLFSSGKLVIPQFDFAIGEGADIIQTLHYYGIGDPIVLLSVFVPHNLVFRFYEFSVFLRMYLAGLAFVLFCTYLKKPNFSILLSVAICYAFNNFAIGALKEHIFFANPLIYQPLIFLGIEKLLRENKTTVLVLSVFAAALCNIYFFYMIVLNTVIYVIVRILCEKAETKTKVYQVLKITIFSFLGTMMAAWIVLPMMNALLMSSRVGSNYAIHWTNPASYFIDLFTRIDFTEYSKYNGGYSLPSIFALIYLFFQQGNKSFKVFCLVGLVLAIFPIFSKLYNGMAYSNSTRWFFIYRILFCYAYVCAFENENIKFDKNLLLSGLASVLLFVISCFVDSGYRIKVHLISILSVIAIIAIIKLFKRKRISNILISLVCVGCLFINLFFDFSSLFWNYSKHGVPLKLLNPDELYEIAAISRINDDTFWRYSGSKLTDNISSINGTYSTQFYWSISNENVTSFRNEMGLLDKNGFHYNDYYNRDALIDLASVKYYVVASNSTNVPRQFDYLFSDEEYDVYINRNALPLIYAYKDSLSYEEYEKSSIVEKQEALLKYGIIESGEKTISLDSSKSGYIISSTTGVNVSENAFDVYEKNATITFEINDVHGELFYTLINLNWLPYDDYDWRSEAETATSIYIQANGKSQEIDYKTNNHARYSNKHNFCVIVGEGSDETITVNMVFADRGLYSFNDFLFEVTPIETIDTAISKINKNVTYTKVDVNRVKAGIVCDNDEIICLSIPYSTGWSAYLNGKKVELKKVNGMYMGFRSQEGENNIELMYETPYLKLGTAVSLVSSLIFIAYIIADKKKLYK